MTAPTIEVPRIVALADRLERDIHERKLKPGDRYLSAAAAARMLRVSGAAANRALQLLSLRGVVERRQRMGAVVSAPSSVEPALGAVHLLLPHNYLETDAQTAESLALGLQRTLPRASLRFHFLARDGAAEQAAAILRGAAREQPPSGLVLVRSGLATQRLVAASGLPAAVYGTVYPSVSALPSLDRDQRQTGYLLARHLLDRGRRRLLVVMRDRFLPGDQAFLDGIAQALSDDLLPADALVLRCLPEDRDAVAAMARAELAGDGPLPGIVCRSELLAAGVADALRTLGHREPADVLGVGDAHPSGRLPAQSWTCVDSASGPEEHGARLAQLLTDQLGGRKSYPPPHLRDAVRLLPAE